MFEFKLRIKNDQNGHFAARNGRRHRSAPNRLPNPLELGPLLMKRPPTSQIVEKTVDFRRYLVTNKNDERSNDVTGREIMYNKSMHTVYETRKRKSRVIIRQGKVLASNYFKMWIVNLETETGTQEKVIGFEDSERNRRMQ
ncbi:hypothetical protein CC1G_13614 [Coprinopsis cinerea okayama7|uniref:Uncharacterized protein n=1 Tax=Coprinopsis cinerea (strain Okayama-7 / 130 / ATCC MYA-4618 / FGSC 9003) TaxID=240176 RepID=D6RJW9_COPC7|nr:hypothetical protein CC1G_13614 [Coprinopsis cinerea okayama7\|eukprot:XP_002912081.1 hypothetical protein CC1G_13614 [Coprinopsis cinerea okayama7\